MRRRTDAFGCGVQYGGSERARAAETEERRVCDVLGCVAVDEGVVSLAGDGVEVLAAWWIFAPQLVRADDGVVRAAERLVRSRG